MKAVRAAETAASMSVAEAPVTVQISDSSLGEGQEMVVEGERGGTHLGFTLVILSPVPLTHSLLMKRPVGWVYSTPLGALSLMERSAMLVERKMLDVEGFAGWKVKGERWI